MNKRNIVLIGVLASLSITSLYAAPVSTAKDVAVQKATKHVPKGSKLSGVVAKDDEYEIRFVNKDKGEVYEVEVDMKSQAIKEFKSEKIKGKGSNNVKLSKEEIKKIILKQHPKVEFKSIELDTEDNLKEYEVKVSDATLSGEIEVNPETGAILQRDFDIKTKSTGKESAKKNLISVEKAKQVALKKVPHAVVKEVELDFEKGKYIYEIDMVKDGYEYELKVDAKTGNGIYLYKDLEDWFDEKDDDNDDKDDQKIVGQVISLEKAKNIALAKVPHAKFVKAELDDSHYEIEMTKGNMKYELEIDAVNGQITEFDTDEIDD